MGGAGFFGGMTGPIQTPVISRRGAGADAFAGAGAAPRRCAKAGTAMVQTMNKAGRLANHVFMLDLLLLVRFAIIQSFPVSFGDPKQTSEGGSVSCRIHINLHDL